MTARFCQRLLLENGGLGTLADELDAYLCRAGVPEPVRAHLLLAADELGANVASHAYPNADVDAPRWLEVAAWRAGSAVHLTFADGGRPFDPHSVLPADTAVALDDRTVGGLGILLVRRLMDRVDYRRVGNENRVSLLKCWQA